MGGAKCSYKNCTVRSDRGKIHMFHYPVLDRARCHKWLMNAHRQDFLNLKVSQLKNRMICQYHFTPDDFMNDSMVKLKATAVPTLDGPYCDSKKLEKSNDKQENFDSFMLEEIENLTYPRKYIEKDMFSKSYSSFLTDCEVFDGDFNPVSSKVDLIDSEVKVKVPFSILKAKKRKSYGKTRPPKAKTSSQPGAEKSPIQFCDKPVEIPIEFEKLKNNNNSEVKNTKIKILSEEQIYELDPVVPLLGNFEPVKPDTILPLPNKKKQKTYRCISKPISYADTVNKQEAYENVEKLKVNDVQPQVQKQFDLSYETPTTSTACLQSNKNMSLLKDDTLKGYSSTNNNQQTVNQSKPTKAIVPLPARMIKLDPKRASAIQEKRNFNKKLRDMISFEIDVTDLSPKKSMLNEEFCNTTEKIMPVRIPEKHNSSNCIKTHLAEDKSLPSVQEYAFAALEARMTRMEELLLNKIEHNTQTIINLKKSVDKQSVRSTCVVSTQTESDEKLHKKFLFKEISKYLSANANSLIFEELFIDTHVADIPKRRKLR